jgi:hypothetical protein
MIPTSIVKKVDSDGTEQLNSESVRLANPSDLANDAEELLGDVMSTLEPDDVPLEGTMLQTEASELEPVKRVRRPRKERWVPIEFPPLPPRSESNAIQVEKSRCFFY